MQIRGGFEIIYDCPQPTPMLLMLNVHPSRQGDLLAPERLCFEPEIRVTRFLDSFDNLCARIVAPAGRLTISSDFVIRDSGQPDPVALTAEQHRVEDLPDSALVFLLGSRYCDTDRLSDLAWSLFGGAAPGWSRVQAICDYVHNHMSFGYEYASATRTASEGYSERLGVCRDFAHLSISLCRCMNIPARYCTGYLGDIGVPAVPLPMDFSAWFEAYLGGRWYAFDARHNMPRIGRILVGRGRDATDVALS
ncbi:MAG TPA: transglutaminase family protein, partial [Beijerinckiaceae bacterium]|nr:transglutaminase family protein [Beijerinckiaceae bacterium]